MTDVESVKRNTDLMQMIKTPLKKVASSGGGEFAGSCPFCGGKDVKYYNGWGFGDRGKDNMKWREPAVSCSACGIGFCLGSCGRGVSDEIAMAETIAAWNRRAHEEEAEDD